ncbi:cell division protein FtsL [Allofrancisella frigidaquae]|uniref:Cell division protein FtsL n=1 Tax=Allofrancisella frigidaquae TaxID=1085644 RepID=A0A6M3HUA7_9GAMM|nr:cell division protein FtsL [Allofrancisella frigidaquae]KEI35531.1 cell division protein FtsL [Francisella sp. W12-1067]QIV94759.1 cell division protein FtsL [Allofrancisella frigidaquae]
MMLTNRQIRIRLFESLRNSFFRKTVAISFVLLFLLLVTAFSLIVLRFEYKIQLNEQKELIVEKTKLDEQWSQIVLEYSSLATPTVVENFAQKEHMSLPTKNDIKFLNEGVDE